MMTRPTGRCSLCSQGNILLTRIASLGQGMVQPGEVCLTTALLHLGSQDALRRAVAEDGSLVEQYPELASLVAKNEAEASKELGNRAFSEKRYPHWPPDRCAGNACHAGLTGQPHVLRVQVFGCSGTLHQVHQAGCQQ